MVALGGVTLIGVAYALGAIPWGVVLGRIFTGVDLRGHGSGATGTTNALRVLGWRISVAVFVLDFAKGLLPVLIGRWIGLPGWAVASTGIAAVAGHCWSPYIGLRGGKGMATGAGAAAGLLPWVLVVTPAIILVILRTKYVSLGSLVGSGLGLLLVLIAALLGWSGWWVAGGVAVIVSIIVLKHRGNIRRLLDGTERRFGERAPSSRPSTAGHS
ncbi:MAG: glycerol-3-phosphate 1-O-acyltransferase PlsY [Chloroflexota bacterium]|nr:glycerol-3-phosphate 1-O-acyltransferase PlsY [Chloroflexota bacterium]